MSTARYLIGDTFDVMASMPDDSVDLVLTSPPFLDLRRYLPDDHPAKEKEIGRETTPAAFLDTLLALTAEWGRLLAPHGSIAVELGDTYASSGATPSDVTDMRWPLDKSLCGIPHLYHLSLAWGRNLLTGAPSPAGLWRVRNVVAWCRPNPAVGAPGDKYRPAVSYMTIATRDRNRWFDLDAVRTMTERHAADVAKGTTTKHGKFGNDGSRNHNHGKAEYTNAGNPAGAPPHDWWVVATEAYPGSHYATWPRKLLDRPIASMCPREVCTTCGSPRRRIALPPATEGSVAEWSDCGHNSYRRGHVLDPFGGSGTTAVVATGHGRDCTLIDIDERNAELARQRVGVFLQVS